MPLCTSLMNHNPTIFDLLECISPIGREHELFARYIHKNTETEGMLFTPRKSIAGFTNIDNLIAEYNKHLYLPKHEHRIMKKFHDCVYINGYVDDSAFIIKKLRKLSAEGVAQYTTSVDSWLATSPYTIDSIEKENALRTMFASSRVALVYGSAGTGKSTLINHISNFFAGHDKIFLANTHPAVDNMRRKVSAGKSYFDTIASFTSKKNRYTTCDVLVVDECSTVSNADMRKVLEKATFKLLVLVGDVYQIESIYFGNWFDIVRNLISESAIFELKHPYRTENENLLTVWDRVRNLDIAILEPLVKSHYSARLDDSLFTKAEKDEIVLCLNYDGLYGINNINRFLQNSNTNPSIVWGVGIYKIGDPINS